MNILESIEVKRASILRHRNPRLIIPLATLTGLLLGVIARLWMRWISTEPEFTWSGSIFIVLAITIFFTAHATVFFALRQGWSRRSLAIARSVAILFSLPIFSAAGGQMLPTVLTASLALWRKTLPKWLRVILGITSLVIPIVIVNNIGDEFGWGIVTIGRILLFVFIYSAVIAMTKATVTKSLGGKPMRRRKEIIVILIILLVLFGGVKLFMFGVGGSG